jgi:TfoX/Sxy family transcriptional regulator of competence genes
MAYDELVAQRIRDEIGEHPGLSERKMFGGLAFLIEGHIAVVASGQGGMMVRVDPATADRAVASGHGELAVMRGRAMRGWLRLAGSELDDPGDLSGWIDQGLAFAATLPPKH